MAEMNRFGSNKEFFVSPPLILRGSKAAQILLIRIASQFLEAFLNRDIMLNKSKVSKGYNLILKIDHIKAKVLKEKS